MQPRSKRLLWTIAFASCGFGPLAVVLFRWPAWLVVGTYLTIFIRFSLAALVGGAIGLALRVPFFGALLGIFLFFCWMTAEISKPY